MFLDDRGGGWGWGQGWSLTAVGVGGWGWGLRLGFGFRFGFGLEFNGGWGLEELGITLLMGTRPCLPPLEFPRLTCI